MNDIRHIISIFVLTAITFVLGGCSLSDEWEQDAAGYLQLSIPNVSAAVSDTYTTRSTPATLGTPQPASFQLNIVRQSNGVCIYDGAFTSEKITAAPDEYAITVSHGTNPLLGIDAPYYIGTATATVVSTTEPTQVNVPISIGNALISVVFGDTETNAARFDRFYEDYAFTVSIGNTSASISPNRPEKSVYVKAGSTVALSFTGRLQATGQQVSIPLALPDDMSYTLEAKKHLIVTLSLEPNAESATVNVVKAEMEQVDVDENISYNWLPRPVVTTQHQYVSGNLAGTDLNISASFPNMTWEARIHQGSASGNVVRVLTGTGALTSLYQDNADWPFLPAGNYVATYTYTNQQGKTYNFSKTTEFTIPQPQLTITTDAYTSYSKYQEGSVDEANACERLTLYKPKAQWNVSATLLANSNYTKTFTYSIGNQSFTAEATKNNMTFANITGIPVSGNLYDFTMTGNFCGQTVTATKQVRITGLPYAIDFSSHDEWTNSGDVTWEDNIAMGFWNGGSQSITTNSAVYIPQGTKYCADYNVNVHTGTVGSTFTITAGSQVLLSIKEGGGTFLLGSDHMHSGTTNTFTANSNITTLTCTNSYGAGATGSYIYNLGFRYGE